MGRTKQSKLSKFKIHFEEVPNAKNIRKELKQLRRIHGKA